MESYDMENVKANMILETQRLYLREMQQSDFESLCKILQDQEAMYTYEGAFCDDEVQEWLDRQIARYQKWGFGLWAVIFFGGPTGITDMLSRLPKPVKNTRLKP